MRSCSLSIVATRVGAMTLAFSLWALRANAGICADVDLRFAGAPSRELVVALEQEATAIWAPYAVDLHWQTGVCPVEDASFDLAIERHASVAVRQIARTAAHFIYLRA